MNEQQNLRVVTDHVNTLAEKHQSAANLITGANRMTADIAGNVLTTHGLVCSATSIAISSAETARETAGAVLFKVSNELAAKLATAAINYNDTDYRAGNSLGQACQM